MRAAGAGFASSGRFARPAQLDPALMDHMSGGLDPQQLSDMSHATAASLLDRVHHTADPEVVRRTLNLVETEGVDLVAELWSHSDSDTLPGVLWRLYMLRTWMQRNRDALSRIWRVGEPAAGPASVVAGIDEAPTADDIADTADSILSGAFTGDFAMALDRAGVFCDVIARGLTTMSEAAPANATHGDGDAAPSGTSDTANSTAAHGSDTGATTGVKAHAHANAKSDMQSTAASLHHTAQDFHVAATLWREGRLD